MSRKIFPQEFVYKTFECKKFAKMTIDQLNRCGFFTTWDTGSCLHGIDIQVCCPNHKVTLDEIINIFPSYWHEFTLCTEGFSRNVVHIHVYANHTIHTQPEKAFELIQVDLPPRTK
jgi:hypothetical protein